MIHDKNIVLPDFLTAAQIKQALTIWKRNPIPAREIAAEVIEPNMEVIESKIGQKCDALYLAYCVEYVFDSAKKRT